MAKFAETCRKVRQIPDNNNNNNNKKKKTLFWQPDHFNSLHAEDAVKTLQFATLSLMSLQSQKPVSSHVVITDSRKSDLRVYVNHRQTWQSNYTIIGHWFKTAKGETDRHTVIAILCMYSTVIRKGTGPSKVQWVRRLAQSVTLRPVVSRWPVVISPALKKYLK